MATSDTPVSAEASLPHDDAVDSAKIQTLASGWISAVTDRVRLVSQLAVAEAQLAAMSAAGMVFLAVLAAGLVLGAWGLLMSGTVYALYGVGMSLWIILLLLGLLHIGVAVFLWFRVVALSDRLTFTATRHQLGESTGDSS